MKNEYIGYQPKENKTTSQPPKNCKMTIKNKDLKNKLESNPNDK
jgi:hypothetical protein